MNHIDHMIVSLPLPPSLSLSYNTQYLSYNIIPEYRPRGLVEVQYDGIEEKDTFMEGNQNRSK